MRTTVQNNSERSLSLVFVGLLLLTGSSLWLAEGHSFSGSWPTVLIVTIAGAKLHLVGMHFVELRHAPLALKLIFDGWIVAVWGLIIGLTLIHG
jgi:hypothetical protein